MTFIEFWEGPLRVSRLLFIVRGLRVLLGFLAVIRLLRFTRLQDRTDTNDDNLLIGDDVSIACVGFDAVCVNLSYRFKPVIGQVLRFY